MTTTPLPLHDSADTEHPSDAGYAPWLLAARQRPAIRNALRRGGIEATAYQAYPHLARFWQNAPWLKEPLLLHASVAATFSRIGQANDVGLGNLAKALQVQNLMSADTIGARLLAAQTMSLPNAHRLLSGLLHAADGQGITLDWSSTWDLYRWWDQPNRQHRLRTRRRLLEQFYS
ncbi:MAG: type I-E CRISPR-associated protein Cse2/CasB [Acidimicrobiales bacterium]